MCYVKYSFVIFPVIALAGAFIYLIYRGNNHSFKNLTCGSAMTILKNELTGLCFRTPAVATAIPPHDQRHADVKYETTATHSDDEETVELTMYNKYPAAAVTVAQV